MIGRLWPCGCELKYRFAKRKYQTTINGELALDEDGKYLNPPIKVFAGLWGSHTKVVCCTGSAPARSPSNAGTKSVE